MTLEDPFYVVKDEVFRALNKTRGLYLRWQEINKAPTTPNSPEAEWTSTELRNALRSIEWDLEDLQDTISIVEKNSSKFRIDNKEICDRKTFIEATMEEVNVMKTKINCNRTRDNDGTARVPLLAVEESSPSHSRGVLNRTWTSTPKYSKYSKLANQTDSPRRNDEGTDIVTLQQVLIENQDDQLQDISDSMGSLRTLSRQIGFEIDEQSMIMDDLGADLENVNSRLDSRLKQVSRVLRLNNGGRQWVVILILIFLVLLTLLLFIIL